MFNFKNEIKDVDMAPEELERLLRDKFGGNWRMSVTTVYRF